jgi:hypothetical protein
MKGNPDMPKLVEALPSEINLPDEIFDGRKYEILPGDDFPLPNGETDEEIAKGWDRFKKHFAESARDRGVTPHTKRDRGGYFVWVVAQTNGHTSNGVPTADAEV